ncbi:MAG: ATPase, T2SS/T4P/T4SS family, partial [Planctomycetota bacterium]
MAEDIGQMMVRDGLIGDDQLLEAYAIVERKRVPVEQALLQLGYVDQAEVKPYAARLAGANGSASTNGDGGELDIERLEIDENAISKLAESLCREHTIIPIEDTPEYLKVAFVEPNLDLEDKLRFIAAKEIEVVTASPEQITAAIEEYYGGDNTETVDSMLAEFTETAIDFTATDVASATQSEKDDDENSPVVRLCNMIISEAVKMRASDIHIEPFEDRVRIRYRIDGKLLERDKAPRRLLPAITSRIKVMGGIDIAEKRR